jgi:hypothetical protein
MNVSCKRRLKGCNGQRRLNWEARGSGMERGGGGANNLKLIPVCFFIQPFE